MEPITPPTPTPPAEPVVEMIRTNRQGVGYALTAVAVAFLVVAVALAMKSDRLPATSMAVDAEKDAKADPLRKTPDAPAALQATRTDYLGGSIGAALGLVIAGAGAAYLIVGLPKPTEAEQRREARVVVLAVGGLLGAALILFGAWYFWRWGDSLVNWLDKGELKEARYALYPILMVVLGGGLTLLAVQPARAEERNNTTIRRLVYGSNLALTVLILFVVLVVVNAVVAMRLPNKMDVTNTGFYTLDPQTVRALEGLEQPVRAYAIFQGDGDPLVNDIKRLLNGARDVNPGRFQVRFVSPAGNREEFNRLRADHPNVITGEGVLLVAGEEDGPKRPPSFIRREEFEEETAGPEGRPVLSFTGEGRLLREIQFLAENKVKPKVYFTQSAGELSLAGGGRGVEAARSASAVADHLRKSNFEVLPLPFGVGTAAKVPDDAAVVVVADPQAKLPDNAVEAIHKYMTEPRAGGKKGKLIVLSGGTARGPDAKPLKLGLEPTLAAFGVGLADRFVYAEPTGQADPRDPDQGSRTTISSFTKEAVDARNPVAIAFASRRGLPMLDWRPVTVTGAPKFQAVRLLIGQPGERTWTEPVYQPNPVTTWNEFVDQLKRIGTSKDDDAAKEKRAVALIEEKELTVDPRPLAVLVSEPPANRGNEPPTARVAVFGCGWFVSDAVQPPRGAAVPVHSDLMRATLDWIRDRPVVTGVSEKPYSNYRLEKGYDVTRLVWLPLGVGLMTVLGLGAGVWVIRRK